MRELDPTAQDEVKRMARSMKGHITGGHDNKKAYDKSNGRKHSESTKENITGHTG